MIHTLVCFCCLKLGSNMNQSKYSYFKYAAILVFRRASKFETVDMFNFKRLTLKSFNLQFISMKYLSHSCGTDINSSTFPILSLATGFLE